VEEQVGFVTLVGAGPGDPGLLTLAGKEALEQAEVVLFDRLANPELLKWTPEHCLKVPVGKQPGCHAVPQERINALLVEYAQQGRRVVRLKGGDPFVFGRGGEEVSALKAHGIGYRVIPGISSAIAGPAAAGIPVTDRRCSASFRVVTGNAFTHHQAGDLDWADLAAGSDTLVILMGHATVALLAEQLMVHGRASETPAAVIQEATTPRQKSVTGTLGEIARLAREAHLGSPAIVVVGDVVDVIQGK